MPPETRLIWCFPEGLFPEIVFGRLDLSIFNDLPDHVQAFRKTLVMENADDRLPLYC